MCGIAGIYDLRGGREVDVAALHRMNESQYHRGPNDGDVYVKTGVGLAHRRLSIIDVAGGQQPMFNEDNTVVTIFNGEIYNYQELIRELVQLGHVFRTSSDTEVIVHAWESWGERCVERFRGMFAFALWDSRTGKLFIARDRLGVKPLYYAVLPGGWFVFGSELKALLAHGGLSVTIDPLAVEEYFALGYVADPRTIFSGACKLPPAHTMTLAPQAPAPALRRFWDVRFDAVSSISEQDACAELTRRLEESIRLRMISEVPLGAFLSGGVDSSSVVAMMAQASAEPINTCSVGFRDRAFDESKFAAEVSRRYATRHHLDMVESEDFGLIDTLARVYDEPYADSSAIPTYRVCQLARQHVTVALSGDGADENFGGYRRHRLHLAEERVRAALPLSVRRPMFGLLGRAYPKADWAPRPFRAKTTFEALARDSVDAYFHSVSVLSDGMRDQLFSKTFRSTLAGYRAVEVFRGHAGRAQTDDALSLVQYIDLHTYLVGDINTKVDRASMAHSLEVREPFLDHPLVEWLASLPSSLKIRAGEGKYLLKKAMTPHLPHDILYRPKMGFSIPLARWFRGPLRTRVRESLLGPALAQTGMFDQTYLRHMVDAHESGMRDYSAPIWSLVMFEAFLTNVVYGGSKVERSATPVAVSAG